MRNTRENGRTALDLVKKYNEIYERNWGDEFNPIQHAVFVEDSYINCQTDKCPKHAGNSYQEDYTGWEFLWDMGYESDYSVCLQGLQALLANPEVPNK